VPKIPQGKEKKWGGEKGEKKKKRNFGPPKEERLAVRLSGMKRKKGKNLLKN